MPLPGRWNHRAPGNGRWLKELRSWDDTRRSCPARYDTLSLWLTSGGWLPKPRVGGSIARSVGQSSEECSAGGGVAAQHNGKISIIVIIIILFGRCRRRANGAAANNNVPYAIETAGGGSIAARLHCTHRQRSER